MAQAHVVLEMQRSDPRIALRQLLDLYACVRPCKSYEGVRSKYDDIDIVIELIGGYGIAKELVLSHQEKWDGSGYPQRLSGTQIPASARIMALADVYDALITNKVYKDGVSHTKAVEVILSERGAHFDPDVVDAFLVVETEFQTIAQRFADTDADMQRKMEYMANAIAENAEL